MTEKYFLPYDCPAAAQKRMLKDFAEGKKYAPKDLEIVLGDIKKSFTIETKFELMMN
ncbi:MAG: hypothetical protein AABX93_03430 [Nanoarchaeota archaeon]